jgi:cobyrinic acid a,c-diamide synthase
LGLESIELPGGEVRGHSFHHSALESPMTPTFTGRRRSDGQPSEPFYRLGPVRASYLHLYFPSTPEALAALFVP